MKQKIIYLNGNIFAQPVTGVQRFGIELIRQLDTLAPIHNIHFILLLKANLHPHFTSSLKNITVKKRGLFTGKLWEQIDLFFLTWGKPLITFASGAPACKQKQYFAIHDASVYHQAQSLSYFYRLWYRSLYAVITRFAKSIITVSQFSSTELQKALHISANKIAIIHDGGDHLARIAADNAVLLSLPANKKIVFVVGSLNPSKNFTQVMAVAKALQSENEIHFVIAGNINNAIFTNSSNIKNQLAADNISFLGAITDAQLKALYGYARCFLFLSLYEGFGIPVAEALAAGCPVICSNAACMPELFSQFAHMVNPHETGIIAEAVKRLCFNDETYQYFKQKAAAGAQVYTWSASAQTLLQLIKQE